MKGSGTKLDPYIIENEADLYVMIADRYAHYRLAADIELSAPWPGLVFYGGLDGRGYTISNLEVNGLSGADHAGFFNQLLGSADIKNLNLVTNETGIRCHSSKYAGILAGFTNGLVRLENISVAGKVNHESRGSGLIGYNTQLAYGHKIAVFADVTPESNYTYGVCHGTSPTVSWVSQFGVWSSEISGQTRSAAAAGYYGLVNLTRAKAADPANYPAYFDFENEWEIVDGLARVRKLDPQKEETGQKSTVGGLVQIDSQPAARTVRAFSYDAITHDVDGAPVLAARTLGEAKSDPETGAYSIDLLGGYPGDVFVVAFDDYGRTFAPGLPLAIGERVHPTQPNGYVYECDAPGALPEEEPAWSTDTGTSQLYGTASLLPRAFYRPVVHGPIKPEVISAAVDIYFDSVALLAHFDEGGFNATVGGMLTATGAAGLSTTAKKFGVSAGDFTATGGGITATLTEPMGLGDFTIELFLHPTRLTNWGTIFSLGKWNDPGCLHVILGENGVVKVNRNKIDSLNISAGVPLLTWSHFALSRAAGTIRLFVGGVKKWEADDPTEYTNSAFKAALADGIIGHQQCYIDELRITKGVARYTENFTPPAEPFPNQGPQ